MLDFQAVCSEYNIPFIDSGHHHSHAGWLQIHCPFCTEGSHGWHLGFSLEKGSFNCWRCGSHKTWDVLCKVLRTEAAARKVWAQFKTGNHIAVAPKVKTRHKSLKAPSHMDTLQRQHKRYLERRGFVPEELVKEWDIKATCHLSTEWNWRICFPIYNEEERAVAYCGRSINNETKPKYKMSDNEDILMDPRGLLYGIHKAVDFVVVVEGPMDVWRLGNGAVATLGVDWKVEQAVVLKNYKRRYIMYDPEPQAQKKAEELASWLSVYSGITEVIDGLSCDPGDLEPEEAKAIMHELGNG